MDFVSMTLGLTLISGYIALFLQPNNADAFLKSFFFKSFSSSLSLTFVLLFS